MEFLSRLWWFWYFLRYRIFHGNRFAEEPLTLKTTWPLLCAKPNPWCFSPSQSKLVKDSSRPKRAVARDPRLVQISMTQPVFCSKRQETRICGQFQIHFRYSMSKVRTLVPLQTDNKQTSGGIWHEITQGQGYHSTGPKAWSSLDPWESLSWKNAVDDLTDVISQGLQGHSDW